MLKLQFMAKNGSWMDLTNRFGELLVFKNRENARTGIEAEKEVDRTPPRNKLQYRIADATPMAEIMD